jgi:hypothetical protein
MKCRNCNNMLSSFNWYKHTDIAICDKCLIRALEAKKDVLMYEIGSVMQEIDRLEKEGKTL